MQSTLAPFTGDSFPMPLAGAALAPPQPVGRVRRWSFEIGREGLAICSTVEDNRPRIIAPAGSRPSLALTMAAITGGLALLMVGASAGRAWSPAPPPVEAAMIVPAAKPVAGPTVRVRTAPERRPAAGRIFPTADVAAADAVPTAIAGMSRVQAIARALSTGEFQEWTASDGTAGFAVAGPAETTADGTCRALAVLTRKGDGSDSVASSRECRAADEPARH